MSGDDRWLRPPCSGRSCGKDASMLEVYELFSHSAQKHSGKKALVSDGGTLTYGQLEQKVDKATHGLRAFGIGEGSNVGLAFRNGSDFAVWFLALQKVGASAALINYRLSRSEVAQCIKVAGCSCLLCSDEFADLLDADFRVSEGFAGKALAIELMNVDGVVSLGRVEALDETTAYDSRDFNGFREADHDAVCIFTGGTTGLPKVAVYTHRSLALSLLENLLAPYQLREYDVAMTYAPFFHIGGFTMLLMSLAVGATMVTMGHFTPDGALKLIKEEGVTQLQFIPPTIAECLVRAVEGDSDALASVRVSYLTGGASCAETAKKVFSLCPNTIICNGYGMTERAAVLTQCFSREEFEVDPKLAEAAGVPSMWTECRLLNDEGVEACAFEPGVLWGKNPGMAVRYEGVDGVLASGEFFDTGDVFCRDEKGRYFFISRAKEMIKSGGENVFAAEVESVILSHPDVAECAVFAVPHDVFGEAVAAACVLRRKGVAEEEIAEFVAQRIARFKKPRFVMFLDELPKSGVGKTLKTELQRMAVERIPGGVVQEQR